jgi:hypothetical protein
MIRAYRSVRDVASAIAAASEMAMEAYRSARITDEPHITDRLLQAVEMTVNGGATAAHGALTYDHPPALRSPLAEDDASPYRPRGLLIWQAHTLRSGSRSAAHEKRFGADVLGVLTINTPAYRATKGFLAQAKRAEPGVPFSKSRWGGLIDQCDKMLAVTPDSFVMAYSKKWGVSFFSAQAVRSFSGRDLYELYDMSVRSFFERHIESFIGDRRLNAPNIHVLERLHLDEAPRASAHVLHLQASESE